MHSWWLLSYINTKGEHLLTGQSQIVIVYSHVQKCSLVAHRSTFKVILFVWLMVHTSKQRRFTETLVERACEIQTAVSATNPATCFYLLHLSRFTLYPHSHVDIFSYVLYPNTKFLFMVKLCGSRWDKTFSVCICNTYLWQGLQLVNAFVVSREFSSCLEVVEGCVRGVHFLSEKGFYLEAINRPPYRHCS